MHSRYVQGGGRSLPICRRGVLRRSRQIARGAFPQPTRPCAELLQGFVTDVGIELRLLRVATRIKDLVCESQDGMTEKGIRTVVGDNVGTGKALRSLISQGHLKRIGRGECIYRWHRVIAASCHMRQVAPAILTSTKSSQDSNKCRSTRANMGRSCTAWTWMHVKSKLDDDLAAPSSSWPADQNMSLP